MLIRAVKMEDGLLYKCLAKNEYGSSERLIKLIVLGVPERPAQLRVRDVWSRSALVTWLSQYTSNSRISNYTVQYWRKNAPTHTSSDQQQQQQQQNHRREETRVDGLQSSALLINLLPAVTYEVSVIAHNQVGRSEPSETVNVTTSEEEPSAPPTDVQVESRGSSSLRVMWKVPPAESLNGKLLGFYIGYRPRFASQSHHLGHPLPSLGQAQTSSAQQQQQQQSVIYSFKTADAIESQLFYDTFLTNLKHNQEYEVTVRAFNKAGSGPDCHTVLARTNSAKLPQAPNLQVQRVSPNSVTLRWTSTVIFGARMVAVAANQLSASGGSQSSHATGLEILRYILYYQLQGDLDWYELTVGRSMEESMVDSMLGSNGGGGGGGGGGGPMVKPIGEAMGATSNEVITSQSSVHTLSNLQAGHNYRIYVAAANEYGVGDPSNVVTVKTDSLNSTSSAFLGAALLDSAASASEPGSLESWVRQHWSLHTVSLATLLLVIVFLLIGYITWQYQLKRKYNSSSASSSYPSSWTPAASDTIQSEYSIKRFPSSTIAKGNAGGTGTALGVYDEELNSSRQRAFNHQFHSAANNNNRTLSQQQQLAQQQIARNLNASTTGNGGSTTIRPILSSHYHQPADLMSNSGTLQLHSAIPSHNVRQPKSSSTLNRNQNRQLPPIPYSTLSVKEIGGNSSKGPLWRQQSQSQSQQQPDYRLCNDYQQQTGNLITGPKQHCHQHPSTVGSQTPLIYGVIE